MSDLTPQPVSRKPIRWWLAGLLSATISVIFIGIVLYLNVVLDGYLSSSQMEWLNMASLILPALIFTTVFTALNTGHPNNLFHTIAVAIMGATPSAIACLVLAILLAELFGAKWRWTWADIGYAFIIFGVIYTITAIAAATLWLFFGRFPYLRKQAQP